MARDLILVAPQPRDQDAISAARLEARYSIHRAGPDLDVRFDPEEVLAASDRLAADGCVGTKDRSALLAAVIAERRGLPGPSPAALVNCQHKLRSREIQRGVVPAATPRFTPLHDSSALELPFFVKPVVGRLSEAARRISDRAELAALARDDDYARGYERITALGGLNVEGLDGYVAEELTEGDEVTLEGYVFNGRVTMIGIADSVKYPGVNSFERFEYPTYLDAERCEELEEVARVLLPALEFDGGFFNVEFFVPSEGPATIIEVNGRIASQFAPLVAAVHGRSTYDALFALACGEDPAWHADEPCGVAISYAMRVFSDAYVAGVPAPAPGLELLVEAGRTLSEQGVNDAGSFRLCLFPVFAATREEALARCHERASALQFDLRSVSSG